MLRRVYQERRISPNIAKLIAWKQQHNVLRFGYTGSRQKYGNTLRNTCLKFIFATAKLFSHFCPPPVFCTIHSRNILQIGEKGLIAKERKKCVSSPCLENPLIYIFIYGEGIGLDGYFFIDFF